MAVLEAIASLQEIDSRGEITSYDQPLKFDTAVTTFANLISWLQGLGVAVDTITDGAITKIRISLLIPLPGGIKATPTAGTDNEKTGLFTMSASGTPNAYGDDVPGIKNSVLVGNAVDLTNAGVAAFVAYITTVATGITPTDRYGNALVSARRANLTFRKHRRALRRA